MLLAVLAIVGGLALGNAYGSNITDIALILGLVVAMPSPMKSSRN
jgi:Ca2+/Na+ antiporter